MRRTKLIVCSIVYEERYQYSIILTPLNAVIGPQHTAPNTDDKDMF